MKGARAFVAYEGASSQKIKDISEQLLRKVLEVAELDPLSVEREPLFEVEPLQARWIRHTGQRSAARPLGKFSSAAQRVRGGRPKPRLVLVGSSTGGPRALQEVLSALPPDFPSPILVAQHMPGSFTRRLAQRLDQACSLHVQEVREPIEMIPGGVYIAQGDMDVQVELIQGVLRAIPVDKDTSLHFHPSVERMVCSSLESCWPRALVGVMLSGMGDDGAKAMTQLKFKGGATIAESQESAVVFGMPQALVASHGATVVLHCKQIADQLLEWARYGVGFDSSTG
jgi:two-component system chemotaxis response regulator CheB